MLRGIKGGWIDKSFLKHTGYKLHSQDNFKLSYIIIKLKDFIQVSVRKRGYISYSSTGLNHFSISTSGITFLLA